MSRFAVLSLVASTLILAACSSGDGDKASKPPQNADEPNAEQTFEGDVAAYAEKIYAGNGDSFFSSCDWSNRSQILTIARDLQNRKAEITAFAQNQAGGPNSGAVVTMGNFAFRETPAVNTSPEWIVDAYGWKDVFDAYARIKDRPVDSSWVKLDSTVRGLLVDDNDRIVEGLSPRTGRLDGPVIRSVASKVEACDFDPSCNKLDFTTDETAWLRAGGWIMKTWDRASYSTGDDFRYYLKQLRKETDLYSKMYRAERTVAADFSGRTMTVRMNLDVLGAGDQRFIDIVEKAWSIAGFEVKVLRRSQPAYFLSVDSLPTGRAFVSRSKQLMQVYNLNTVKTLIHEFGHVMGLRDEYYSSFDSSACVYKTDLNEDNIMSAGYSGRVLPEHWEILKSIY